MLGLILEFIPDVIRIPAKRAMNHFDGQSHFDEQRLGLQSCRDTRLSYSSSC
jgi:hypothetical protein